MSALEHEKKNYISAPLFFILFLPVVLSPVQAV